jgi:hypothetical protein
MKKNTPNNLKAIKNISSKMPKSINEAINFNDDMAYEGEDMEMMDEPMEEPMEEPVEEPQEMGAEKLLADIRKMSINGLAKLADNPDDPNYEMLKKIFLMLDKAVTEKQEQREVMAKNPNAGQQM